jgi:glycosyltransferase involved in cell wall biosynthesis
VRIALDEQAFQIQTFGGVSRYVTRLAEELNRAGEDVRVFAPLHRNEYLRNSAVPKTVWFAARGFPPKTGRLVRSFNRYVTGRLIPTWRPDVVHETFYSPQPLAGRRLPTVVTVHDMIHERFPEMFTHGVQASREKATAIARADHAICVSEATRRDLCEIFDFPVEKTSVVHHGVDRPNFHVSSPSAFAQGRPFLLYVGLRGGYKNFARLVRAVALSPRLRREFDVVTFGGPRLTDAERNEAAKLGLAPTQLRYAGRGEKTLSELYWAAAAFVYPSLYEGFGMPLLESMAHDCPVVSSLHGPCPEVCGAAAEYFDGMKTDDIGRAIESVVFSPTRRHQLVQAGRARITLFTWARCAMATRDAYDQVLKANG